MNPIIITAAAIFGAYFALSAAVLSPSLVELDRCQSGLAVPLQQFTPEHVASSCAAFVGSGKALGNVLGDPGR